MKEDDTLQNATLSELQIQIPVLFQEKTSLQDESEAIAKQLTEEKQRHHQLQEKYSKLHMHFMESSRQAYYR